MTNSHVVDHEWTVDRDGQRLSPLSNSAPINQLNAFELRLRLG